MSEKGLRPTETEVAALEADHSEAVKLKPGYCGQCYQEMPCLARRLAAWYRHLSRHEPDMRDGS